MPRGRRLAPLALSAEQREQLLAWTRSTSMPRRMVQRARIVLASAEGLTNTEVARRLAVSLPTVGKWRRRFLALGVPGLHDDARPGRPRTYDDQRVAAVIRRALYAQPGDSTTRSVRRIADSEGVSKSTAQRWFARFGVRPHRSEAFKLSDDPFFIERVRDITGLYLNPPHHAVTLCVDGNSRFLAQDSTPPALPTGLGYAEGYTHDYVRHGATTLFAALDVATGKGAARRRERHGHGEWLAFLRLIDRETPEGLDLHLVCDSHATHKHSKVRAWVAKRPRIHFHFTPTYDCWLSQIDRCFGLTSQRAAFRAATELTQRITELAEQYNTDPKPFVWVATVDSILGKREQL